VLQWNSKAAIMRLGLVEMQRFAEKFFPGVHPGTWTDSCGVADLIATCCGGRNFRCAREFVQGKINGSSETMDAVEVTAARYSFCERSIVCVLGAPSQWPKASRHHYVEGCTVGVETLQLPERIPSL
jgi:hypothetical protein